MFHVLGPNLILVRGLVKFVPAVARPKPVWVLLDYFLKTLISGPLNGGRKGGRERKRERDRDIKKWYEC